MIHVPEHPKSYLNGYYPEHRVVMERKLGRQLDRRELVIHLNGILSDNSPENLNIFKRMTRRTIKQVYIQVYAPGNPDSDSHGWIMEHRLVMAKHIGRPLKKTEIVHHRDENKTNNHIDNLQIVNLSEHAKHHHPKRKCKLCGKFGTYGDGLCVKHYKAKRYREKRDFTRCSVCKKPVPKRTLARDGKVKCRRCRFPTTWCKLCDQITYASELCKHHYKQWRYCASRGLTYDAFKRWLFTRKCISQQASDSAPPLDHQP